MYTLCVPRKINFILYFWIEPSSSKITTTIVAKEGFTWKEYNKSQLRTPKAAIKSILSSSIHNPCVFGFST